MADETKVFVNIAVDPQTRQQLDRMVLDFGQAHGIESNRSSFIRMLIRREWERRSESIQVAETVGTPA